MYSISDGRQVVKVKIYSLTGRAGTGKSFHAINLCAKLNIESIIDDGLFIYKNRVEAGKSSKRQKTRVGAIKTALFTDDEHCDDVKKAIKKVNPESILIIGTSDEMADRITKRLGLPIPSNRIYIEDITTEEERREADRERTKEGKHIIPVPTLQLRRDFAGYFMDPMRFLRERDVMGRKEEREKTVVRPTYSYMGDFYISDTVFSDIAKCIADEMDKNIEVAGVYENTSPDNMIMKIIINTGGESAVWNIAEEFHRRFLEITEQMTAYNIVNLEVEVRNLI